MKRVVITGMGIICPIGADVKTFWHNAKNGVCGIGEITRFDTTDFKVKIAAEIKDFDPLKYISKSDIRRTDLFTRYAIAASQEAVDDSGIIGTLPPEELGVYMGSAIGGVETYQEGCRKLFGEGPRRVSPHMLSNTILNIAGGSVAIRFNAQGPCFSQVAACATSTYSIGEAYRAIKHGYATAIIAGGADATVTAAGIAGFTACTALSTRNDPKASSIPFDKRRDGFVMGEGGAVMILEEYEHAVKRDAKIYGEVCGYGSTCDAYHVTAPRPDASGPARAIEQALKEAGGESADNIYINPHGTSTPLNDKTETLAFKRVFGEDAGKLVISSLKSMTGHMMGASGAAEAICTVLAVRDGIIPPTIGYEVPDPECDLDYVPNQCREKRVRLGLSTSLGFGGHNACLAFR